MRKIKTAIKKLDYFATPVSLNYDGNPSHSTYVGGICTILVIIILIFASIPYFNKVIYNDFSQTGYTVTN